MIWTIEWGPVFRRHDLLALPVAAAERLCAAILRFAETGRGPVHRASPSDPRRLILLVPGAVAYMNADPAAGVLLVNRAFRRRA